MRRGRGSHTLQVPRLSDPQDGTKVAVHERFQNRLRKGARLGLSNGAEGARDQRRIHPALTSRSPGLTQLARVSDVQLLKGHGMIEGQSELGDKIYFLLYRPISHTKMKASQNRHFFIGTTK